MRPNAFRTALLTAALPVTGLVPFAAAPPAHAAGTCLAVTGTAAMPSWTFELWPGIGVTPEPQSVSVYPRGFGVTGTLVPVVLTCARADGATTFTGTLAVSEGGAHGASFGPEDVTTGAGDAGGLATTGSGVATLATTAVGTYGTAATAATTVAMTYVRAGATLALVVTLRGLAVDVDGPGAIPPLDWGDVPLATATAVTVSPVRVVDNYLFGRDVLVGEFTTTPATAVAGGT